MSCDICGKNGVYLDVLREEYQTEEIKDLCPDCMQIVNDHLWKIKKIQIKMTQSLLKQFLSLLREKYK